MATITSIDQLRTFYRDPSEKTRNKAVYQIDPHTRTFVEYSPFVTIASVDELGFVDTSPRGGEPGFVKILDQTTLLLPDSKGNNRLDTFENIIARPHIGLMFVLPGVDEVVRMKGIATLHDDESYLSYFSESNFKPTLAMKVDITEIFFHCGKAVMRSDLWKDTYKVDRKILPSVVQILKDQHQLDIDDVSKEEVLKMYRETL